MALWRCHTCWGGADGKASIVRLCLSPYVEKPFNSKVIKGFVPELRSRQVFFVFRDSCVLCIYVMNILCTFPISVSWVWYTIKVFENYKDVIRLNLWDGAFCVLFFTLLSSSLLLLFVSLRFGCSVLRPSLGIPCLSGYRNDSTREIIFKVWLVESFSYPDKQGTPEEGRRIKWPKRCITTNNNKDEDNSPKNKPPNIVYEDVIQIMTSLFFAPINPKNLKKFYEGRHEMNSRRKISWHQLFLIF